MSNERLLPGFDRRTLLRRATCGFGAVALQALMAERAFGGPGLSKEPRVKNVIFLFMDGGVSQVDSFDPKPRLDREHGRPIGMKTPPTQFANVGTVLKSPWRFAQRGQSGLWVSDLFPNIAGQADKLCVIRSMTSRFSEHTSANYFLHTGNGQQGRPSMGAWVTYGLGTDCRDLPGFLVLNGGLIPPGGFDNFANGFLPAAFQPTLLRPGSVPIADLGPSGDPDQAESRKRAFLRTLDGGFRERHGPSDTLDAAVGNYELAFRMQRAVPDLLDLSGESEATKTLYGLDHAYPHTRTYGTLCLLARRLVERGVRFLELTCPPCEGDRWDQHENLEAGHANNARAVDRPIAGLLADLEARGLLDQTLVVWAGEFGRTPMAQGSNGRDHNPFGFSIWLAGGGIRAGTCYGATDDYGYYAVENKAEIHDLHATMLHLLGVDHKQLTFRFGGRDMRLTDVHGEVLHAVLA